MSLPLYLRHSALLLVALTSPATTTLAADSSARDSIAIVHITAGPVALEPGNVVTVSARLDYDLASAPTASIKMIIEDENGHLLDLNRQPLQAVSQGHGSLEFSNSITIPETSWIRVYFPLFISNHDTHVVASSEYPVGHSSGHPSPAGGAGTP